MNTNTTITGSAARVAANRQNAKKSTGPRSAHGKAVVRLNARKHRSLAERVLVRGREFCERSHELTALCKEYYASLAPVGELEEMLVDEIVQAVWRLRRVRKAESGEIALDVDKKCWRRRDENPVARILAEHKSSAGFLRPKLERSVAGCVYLRVCVQKLRAAVRARGGLTAEALADFHESLGNDPDVFVSMLERMVKTDALFEEAPGANEAPREEAPGSNEEIRTANMAEVIELIEVEMGRLIEREGECEREELVEERARLAASVLPGVTAMDRILRYEKGLERQLYGAMDRLQKVQSLRGRAGGATMNREAKGEGRGAGANQDGVAGTVPAAAGHP